MQQRIAYPELSEKTKTSREQETRTVLIVEDDPSVLRSLQQLVRAAGFSVRGFANPGALLQSDIPGTGACLVADVNLPEMNGVDLYRALADSGRVLPLILITGQADDPRTQRLIRQVQAVAVLHKPFAAVLLFDALSAAFEFCGKD